jgi:uncharacterized small protein (DUF1192 family)
VEVDFQEGADDVNTETDLLPLPEGDAAWCYIGSTHVYSADEMESYARANVAHAVATLQAEIEALRAEVERLQSDTSFATAISSLRREKERADKLAEALREARDAIEDWAGYASDYFREKHDLAGDLAKIDAALEQEKGRG